MKFDSARLLCVVVFVLCFQVYAQDRERVVIDEVTVQGLERVSEQLVRSQIQVQPGETLSPRVVSRDIRRLYELGFFVTISADIDTSTGRNILTYIFEEERFIDDVRVIGNKKVKDRAIRGVLTWREGDAFVREGYEEERDAVLALYRSKGFMNTTVDIVVEETAPSRVTLTYIVVEGRKAKIKKIRLEGNQALSDNKLQKVIKTRRALWFFGGRYDDEKFEADLFNVIEAYADVGRLEAAIASTEFDYSKNGKRLEISLFINEGPEYRIHSIEVANNYVFHDDELANNITFEPGDVHNKSKIGEDADRIRDRYTDNGYVNARVIPQVTMDRENKTTTVVHQLREDELKYIREIDITGNTRTKDDVIRRNILLKPGERFDGSKLRASERRLSQTRFFEGTRLRLDDVEGNDRFSNLLVDVDEGRTGAFNFGGAFSTDEGLAGFGELRLDNFDITNWPSFSGGGQQFSTRFSLGTTRTNFRVSFTDPQLGGYPLSFGVDLFNERFRGAGVTDFTTETTGAQIRLGKRLSEFVTARTAVSFTDVTLTNLDTFVDPDLRELQSPGSTFGLSLGLRRDTANDFRDPTAGSQHDVSTFFAGMGMDNEFVKFDHVSSWFFGSKRWDKVSLMLRTREGAGFPYGDSNFLPINQRYFAGGGTTIRGYDFRDVGPKAQTFRIVNGQVIVEEESIGGEFRLVQTVEGKYKLTEMVRLYLFADAGGAWLQPEDVDLDDFRYSVGVGIGMNVPLLGPLRVDYGYPINPDEDQGNGRIHLQSSLRF